MIESQFEGLIKSLRDEVLGLKECFTRFSFQAIAFSGVVLGIVGRFVWEEPETGIGDIAGVVIPLVVARIGTYKFLAANRIAGYELHLDRTKDVASQFRGRWDPSMREIGWEEALRAWRIVQATLFARIYITSFFLPNYRRKEFRENRGALWFCQRSLFSPSAPADYHPGTYLRMMMLMLHFMAALSMFSLWTMTYRVWATHQEGNRVYWFWGALLVTIFISLTTVVRILKDHQRRAILEDGLLSIHSCAIVWQAVIVAHYRALRKTQQNLESPDGAGYKGYTESLAKEAYALAKHGEDIHGWIGGRYSD